MSTLLPIAVSTRRMPAVTATAGQVQFPFTFPIVRPGDVRVRRTRGNVEAELAYGSDYTVWGVNEPAGGTVTLTAGSLAGDLIVVEGDAALDRLSSVAVNGRFSSRQIDQEFNLSLMRDQELRRDLDATIGSAGMQERVEDLIGSSLLAGSGITVTYDDASGKTTLNVVGLAGGGSGNVVGPASSINGRIAVFSGVSGRLLADSGVTTASFAPASHTHTVAQITDFASHTHTVAQITDFASAVSSATAGKLDTSGGTMTGFLTLSGAPTNANHAATKSYVDNNPASPFVLLGTLNTTSGSIQTLSGLNLTSYKFLRIDFLNVSHNSATSQAVLVGPSLGAVTTAQSSGFWWTGFIDVNLSSGMGVGLFGTAGRDAATGLSTASTSVSLSVASGAFDNGSATIYGVR